MSSLASFVALHAIVVATTFPSPPFTAWVDVDSANVRAQANAKSPAVGLVQLGDEVTVRACEPSCADARAWAWLEPFGAIRLALLRTEPSSEMALAVSATARFVYGTVRAGDANVLVEPDKHAMAVQKQKAGHVLAFRDDPELLSAGWLQRPAGGYVRSDRIRLFVASTFEGEPTPELPLAFVLRAFTLQEADAQPPLPIERHARFRAFSYNATSVVTEIGKLPREDVRMATAHPRPTGVGEEDKWVHVDLDEQVLTAYEGDVPVFATLVSSGKENTPTKAGLFRVWSKVIHAAMHGHAEEPYFVDEVPFSLFFHHDMALHGAFWHDRFGYALSHGCINLSVADAEWLFHWAPPLLPRAWHSVVASVPEIPTLWVQIEGSENQG